jgi:hypothetical protein
VIAVATSVLSSLTYFVLDISIPGTDDSHVHRADHCRTGSGRQGERMTAAMRAMGELDAKWSRP